MKRLAVAALVVISATGCSSAPTPSATPTSASSTPTSGSTSLSPNAPTSKRPTPTATASDKAESVGESMGTKIAFYAIAKAAGMNDSAKMDELADGICSRIKSGKPDTVGPWMKDAFQLNGEVAAKVAVAAITSECPEYKSLVGS